MALLFEWGVACGQPLDAFRPQPSTGKGDYGLAIRLGVQRVPKPLGSARDNRLSDHRAMILIEQVS